MIGQRILERGAELRRESISRTLRAMAHPTRLAIIEMLRDGSRRSVTDIHTRLDADQSAISHHLSILRDREVLGTRRDGKFIYYYLKNRDYLVLLDCLTRINGFAS